MSSKRGRKRRLILEALTTLTPPASTAAICAELNSRGIEASDRTVRDYLSQLREEALDRDLWAAGQLRHPRDGITERHPHPPHSRIQVQVGLHRMP